MSYTLTPEQLADLRADIGDTSANPAFTDAELNRLYERAEGDYLLTVVLCLRQLLASAAKMYKYGEGFSRAEQDEIFEQLSKLLDRYEALLDSKRQVGMVGISFRPPYKFEGPSDGYGGSGVVGGDFSGGEEV
ncbi:MAG: hypothetical protein QXS68_03135 [Candidatus Methanomethylicaceae archaeon]